MTLLATVISMLLPSCECSLSRFVGVQHFDTPDRRSMGRQHARIGRFACQAAFSFLFIRWSGTLPFITFADSFRVCTCRLAGNATAQLQ